MVDFWVRVAVRVPIPAAGLLWDLGARVRAPARGMPVAKIELVDNQNLVSLSKIGLAGVSIRFRRCAKVVTSVAMVCVAPSERRARFTRPPSEC